LKPNRISDFCLGKKSVFQHLLQIELSGTDYSQDTQLRTELIFRPVYLVSLAA
jgi:hypothetical protein